MVTCLKVLFFLLQFARFCFELLLKSTSFGLFPFFQSKGSLNLEQTIQKYD
jgi:hypothetical protein